MSFMLRRFDVFGFGFRVRILELRTGHVSKTLRLKRAGSRVEEEEEEALPLEEMRRKLHKQSTVNIECKRYHDSRAICTR